MRKKNAGALFMDFHVSPDDRVGAVPKKARGKAKPQPASKKSPRSARNERQEPRIGRFDAVYDDVQVDDDHYQDERPQRARKWRFRARISQAFAFERRPSSAFVRSMSRFLIPPTARSLRQARTVQKGSDPTCFWIAALSAPPRLPSTEAGPS